MMTTQGGSILKVMALCSALGLAGGYVWMSQRNAATKRATELEVRERTVLPGSKSPWMPEAANDGKVKVAPEAGTSGVGNADGTDRTILPGSKSAAIVLPPEEPAAEPDEVPKIRTVLPGSKSIDRILPPPATEKEQP